MRGGLSSQHLTPLRFESVTEIIHIKLTGTRRSSGYMFCFIFKTEHKERAINGDRLCGLGHEPTQVVSSSENRAEALCFIYIHFQ